MNRGMWRILLVLSLTVPMRFAQKTNSDEDRLTQIRQQALDNSAVDDYAFQLTDVYGARLSGSPSYRRAAEWASRSLRAVGLDSVVLHSAISAQIG